MSKSRAGLLVASMLCATLLLSGCGDDTKNNSYSSAPNLQPKGKVSGVLSDTVTQAPIVGAKVYLLDKSATTGDQGQFLFTDVPANSAVGNELVNVNPGANDAYTVVIDMKDVNAKITEANKKITEENAKVGAVQQPLLALYPGMSYDTVEVKYDSLGESSGQSTDSTNNASFDTPVNGFVASMTPVIGKLDGNLQIQVVDEDLQPVANAKVDLFSINSDNNTTGANDHLVATQTSDASGLVTFSNVEALQIFTVRGTTSTQNNEMGVQAPADNQTSVYLVQNDLDGNNFTDALVLNDNDAVAPLVTDINVEDGSDLAANAAQQVVFTFSEPIKATVYAKGLTQADGRTSLYNDVAVNFQGLKAGNIAHTLAWNAEMTQLTVTFATAASSWYDVDINGALINLEDATGNNVDANGNDYVTFSTFGAPVVVAPVVARVGTTAQIDWLPVPNAVEYAVYVRVNTVGVSSSFAKVGTENLSTANVATLVNNTYGPGSFGYVDGESKVTFTVKVVAVNQDGIEGAASAEVTLDDQVKAQPAADFIGGNLQATGTVGSTLEDVTYTVSFGEQMVESEVETAANWSFTFVNGVTAVTGVNVTVSDIVYNSSNFTATAKVTLSNTNPAIQPITAGTLTITAKDLNGNVAKSDTF